MRTQLSLVLTLVWVLSASAISIQTVPVGNVGNGNDPATGNLYGGVNYAYNIGQYEVTVGEYTAFLNAVAATDTYALYDVQMSTDLNVAGIARSGASGSYTYSTIGSPNHPVTYVSWGDAARFTNWLQNGQPSGAQNAVTTEDGAYTLNGATSTAALNAVSRNANAKWFIPSESEWYKAAYYQPAAQGGDSDNYWDYAMRTNSIPYSDQPPGGTPDNTRVANFYQDDGLANGYDDGWAVPGSTVFSSSQNYLTDVGAYAASPSYYGTFDQGGNLYEWNEAVIGGSRGARGGSWADFAHNSPASYRVESEAFLQSGSVIGFRVAAVPAVPEPSSLLLILMASTGLLVRKRALRYPSVPDAVVKSST